MSYTISKNATNEAKKALLTINPHALQGLHSLIGFDFQQPYFIAHIEGRFTVNAALKAVGGADREHVFALLVADHSRDYMNKLHIVTVDHLNRINIDYRDYKHGLYNLWTKGSFDEMRKSDRAECFIFSQHSKYIKKAPGKPFDNSARYEYIPGRDVKSGDGRGTSWIARITIRALDGSNSRYEITKNGREYHYSNLVYSHPDEVRPESYLEIIDKSGYILSERRADLLRRADQLRKERAKAAYQATDNTAKVDELRSMMETKKREFATAIETATDSETLRSIANRLYFEFTRTMSKFERFADKTARRDFVSIYAAESAYNHIKTNLQKQEVMIK